MAAYPINERMLRVDLLIGRVGVGAVQMKSGASATSVNVCAVGPKRMETL